MTVVPDLVRVAVVAPIGDLCVKVNCVKVNLGVSIKVFLKHQTYWNTVCGAIPELPWHNIWLSDNPVEDLHEHLSLLVGGYVPTKVIRVSNKDKP